MGRKMYNRIKGKTILVSACLLGTKCRYDGSRKPKQQVISLMKQYHLIPVCPEQLGGLKTPREPAEIQSGRVITQNGKDVTKEYQQGAEETLLLAKLFNCKTAILKANSPSCGYGRIYDGSFTKTLCCGNGITAELLLRHGITVYTEKDFLVEE